MARFAEKTYLFIGFDKARSLAEFRLLVKLKSLGLPVPVPVAEPGAAAAANRLPATQVVSTSAPTAEYIPARRESYEPVYGRANQALASYQNTANMPVDSAADSLAGIDPLRRRAQRV